MAEGKNTKRIHRKIERTPEDQARLRAVRERFQAERPSMDDLLASGEYEGPVSLGTFLDILETLGALKKVREQLGLSLADVSERTGIDRAAISRLENGHNANPTIETLNRYAGALGKRLAFSIEDQPAAAPPRNSRHPVA